MIVTTDHEATPTGASSLADLEAEITELAGHLNAASHRWLRLIAEFDRRKGWSDGCTRSCAHWLQWKCGLDLGAAREKVRVARALETVPRIDTAMGCGELSYSKVRALTRVASPVTEELLLSVALHGTTHHVETLVRQFRRVQEVEELSREARQQANRRLTDHCDVDGSLVLKVQLPAEAGALVVLAESFLRHRAEALCSGDRHHIVVHVDECALQQRTAGRCELDDGPALRRALNSRDRGCAFPGCTHKRYVDGHHIRHWAEGGTTRLSNLVSLCRFHHRAVHEGELRVERIDAKTALTRWRGERMDYGMAIDSLLWRTKRGGGVSAET